MGDGYIIRKPQKVHSGYRANKKRIEKLQGRHKGVGKHRGTRNARFPDKRKWILKIRAQRKTLRSLRDAGRIDKQLYRMLYQQCSGGFYKSKSALKERIHVVMKEREKDREVKNVL